MPYETAVSLRLHVIPGYIQAKLDGGNNPEDMEEQTVKGYACLNEELSKEPDERMPGDIRDDDVSTNDGCEAQDVRKESDSPVCVPSLEIDLVDMANEYGFANDLTPPRELTRLVTPPPTEIDGMGASLEGQDSSIVMLPDVDGSQSEGRDELTLTKPVKKFKGYSIAGLSSCRSRATPGESFLEGKRVIARCRKWETNAKKYGEWQYFRVDEHSDPAVVFKLNRGGRLTFWPQLVPNIGVIQREMMLVNEYRQYKVRECGPEPRLHALFASTPSNESGYKYGSVKMKSHPLDQLEETSKLAARLAGIFSLPNEMWNIGLDLLIYRDGKDNINWHADDTQEEDIVLSLTVESPDDPRTICFQPSHDMELQDGDEQIEFFPIAGDCYEMDGRTQAGYVHAVLKMGHNVPGSRRMAIIFRNGKQMPVLADSGYRVESIEAPNRVITYKFGPMEGELIEGECYSRAHLFACGAHPNDRGGVAGSKAVGSPSIVVSNVSSEHGEVDEYRYLSYYAGATQRPQALFNSFVHKKPVRVFRSSNGVNGGYFPEKSAHVTYRYDGVYYVIGVKSEYGVEDIPRDSNRTDPRVFFLVRPEPKEAMAILERDNPCFRPFRSDEPAFFNTTKSEDICKGLLPFDVVHYLNWNPFTGL